MTHRVSIVTPAYQPVARYLLEAYESLCNQELPPDWEWQWVIQEDGQTGEVAAMSPDDLRIHVGANRRSGEPTARNMCLSRATGELIKVLDSDDQLTRGALKREIDILYFKYPRNQLSYEVVLWTCMKMGLPQGFNTTLLKVQSTQERFCDIGVRTASEPQSIQPRYACAATF